METRGRSRAAGISGGSSRLGTLLIAAFAAALVLATIGVAPALAEGDDDSTQVTFTLEEGALYVDAPTTVDLGELATAEELLGGTTATSESFGVVTVMDERSGLLTSWSATAESTDFVLDGAGDSPEPHEVISAGDVTYDPGNFTDTFESLTEGDVDTRESGTLDPGDGDNPVVSTTSLLEGGGAAWEPTLTFDIADGQAPGEYHGTITHSVSG